MIFRYLSHSEGSGYSVHVFVVDSGGVPFTNYATPQKNNHSKLIYNGETKKMVQSKRQPELLINAS